MQQAIHAEPRPHGKYAAVLRRRIEVAAEDQAQIAFNQLNDIERLSFRRDAVWYDATKLTMLAITSMNELLNKARAWRVPMAETKKGAPQAIDVVTAILSHCGDFYGSPDDDVDGINDGIQLSANRGRAGEPVAIIEQRADAAWLTETFTLRELEIISFERGLVKIGTKVEHLARLVLEAPAGISQRPRSERQHMEAEAARLGIPYNGRFLKWTELSERLRLLESPLTKMEANVAVEAERLAHAAQM